MKSDQSNDEDETKLTRKLLFLSITKRRAKGSGEKKKEVFLYYHFNRKLTHIFLKLFSYQWKYTSYESGDLSKYCWNKHFWIEMEGVNLITNSQMLAQCCVILYRSQTADWVMDILDLMICLRYVFVVSLLSAFSVSSSWCNKKDVTRSKK